MKALRCFQPGAGPRRGLHRDCEIFANLCLKLYSLLLLTDGHDVTVGARLAHVPLELHRAVQAHIVEGGLAVGSARAPDETTHLG